MIERVWTLIIIMVVGCIRSGRTVDLWRDVANHSAWKALDEIDCGFSSSDRIIGGMKATLGQFPWITRLGYTNFSPTADKPAKPVDDYYTNSITNNTNDTAVDGDILCEDNRSHRLFSVQDEHELDWMCAGALVTDRHVLTAGHCVQDTGEDYKLSRIRIGEYDTNKNPDCQLNVCAPPIQDRMIRKIIMHSRFNKPPFHNDLAMILLDRPVEFNDYVLPICLPRAEQLSLNINEFVTVAGWGKMNLTTEERASILQYVSLPIVTPETCDSFGRGFRLLETEICAGAQKNKDACVGDSGGPLMKVFDTIDGPKSFLMGIVSFGPTICGIKKPGVYTSIPHFLKWILDNIV